MKRGSETLKAAVIGVGALGRYHAQKYAALPGVELRGIADIDENRANEIAREVGCPAVRAIDDVNLPAAIAAAKPAQIILLRPDTGYWAEERAFMAAFVADVLAEDGRRVNTFTIIYRDWHCDALCVQTSYAAAARELATMFRYMLEVDIGYRTNAAPTAWRDKTLVKEFPQWANRCVADTHEDRIVRQYGERLWVNPSAFGSITLVSLSWRGCNVTESL